MALVTILKNASPVGCVGTSCWRHCAIFCAVSGHAKPNPASFVVAANCVPVGADVAPGADSEVGGELGRSSVPANAQADLGDAKFEHRKTSLESHFEELAISIERGAHVLSMAEDAEVSFGDSDDEVQAGRILSHFLKEKHHITSTAAEAARMGTTVWTLRRFRRMFAASTLLVHARDSLRALNTLASDVLEMGGRCVSLTVKYLC